MIMMNLVLSILFVCIICGAVTVITCEVVLWVLAKALEMEEEFKQMDDDYVTTKDGKRIPYDDDTQE